MATKRNEGPAGRMRGAYAAGDFKAARQAAWDVLHDPGASEAEKAEAAQLRDRTEIDRRALGVALGALALAVLVIVVYLL